MTSTFFLTIFSTVYEALVHGKEYYWYGSEIIYTEKVNALKRHTIHSSLFVTL